MAGSTKTRPVKNSKAGRPAATGGTRRGWWWAAAGGVVLAVVLGWALAAQDDGPATGAAVKEFTHLHGVEVAAWAPQVVFLSTHEGLIRIEDNQWSYVGEDRHDFMGFAAHPSQENVLYSSGHPAPGSRLPNPIGFMVSADNGATWQMRSLTGEVDFHTMSVGAGGAVIYGWNTHGQVGLYRSGDDGHTWTTIAAPDLHTAGGPFSLAAHPDNPVAQQVKGTR